jgi:1-acyl-sn-glycerol-3-phosphate acyltransferase
MADNKNTELTPSYKAFKSYLRFMINTCYYDRTYVIGAENVPKDGTPLLIVSDHQNSLNDALGILFAINDRKVHFITRADVFNIHPLASKFLYWIGLLPVFRLNWEGAESLKKNAGTFEESERNLIEGKTVVIYPEAGHQDHHELGTFSYGYTRMAFEAAEKTGFKEEFYILPSCNHYDDYFAVRSQQIIRFGTPIPISPYYELYREKPRTAQRKVNRQVREQITSMMLNITDKENYSAIDTIRSGRFGREYAISIGKDPDSLPEKLESDKKLFASLEEAKASNPDEVQGVYDDIRKLDAGLEAIGASQRNMDEVHATSDIVFRAIGMLIFLPLAVFCLWPTLLCWLIPRHYIRKVGDKMLTGSFNIALNALFILPICGILTLIFGWIWLGFIRGLAWTLLLPCLVLFDWFYYKWGRDLFHDINFARAEKAGKTKALTDLRDDIRGRLYKILIKDR